MKIKPIPYEQNAKKHTPAQIYKIVLSIRDFGWQMPIKLGKDNIIIAGHARWESYEKYKNEMNLPEPWIINEQGETIQGEPSKKILTSEEEQAYRLADNLLASTDYDMDIVVEETNQLSLGFKEMLQQEELGVTKKEDKVDERFINDEGYLQYLNNTIRQVVLHYEQKDFNELIDKCEKLLSKYKLDTNSDLFKKLIEEEYEKSFSS